MKRVHFATDNLTLMAASQLRHTSQWQRVAKSLLPGQALLVIPADETPLKQSMRRIALVLQKNGHKIVTVPDCRPTINHAAEADSFTAFPLWPLSG